MSAVIEARKAAERETAWHGVSASGRVMRHLIWKDFRVLWPLLLAGVIGTLGLFLLAAIRQVVDPFGDPNLVTFSSLWVLLPNLIAIGVPPMSVGTENEERTFDWLRTLPVKWWQVLLSKVLTGVASWLVMLLIAGGCFWLAKAIFGRQEASVWTDSTPELVGYGLALLACGWIASLLVRNPIASLMLVVPMIAGIAVGWNLLINDWLAGGRTVSLSFSIATPEQRWALAGFAGGLFTMLSLAIAGLARRRLAGPADQGVSIPGGRKAAELRVVTRPDVSQVAWYPRPRPMVALLWQQLRQTRWVLLSVIGIAIASAVLGWSKETFGEIAQLLVIPFLHLVLGVATFYGDRREPRQGFFADRGWPPTLVWLSRMIPTAMVSLAIAFLSPFVFGWSLYDTPVQRPVGMMMAFSFQWSIQWLCFLIGVVTGQWGRRPSLAFFGSPVVACAFIFPMLVLLAFFNGYLGLLWVAVAVWLFATWRLTPLVMNGARPIAVWGRGVAYGLLALGLMCLCIVMHRWWTTPAAMPDWRSKTLAVELPSWSPERFSPAQFDSSNEAEAAAWKRAMMPATWQLDVLILAQTLTPELGPLRRDVLAPEFRLLTAKQADQVGNLLMIQRIGTSNRGLSGLYEVSEAKTFEIARERFKSELESDESCGEFVSQTDLFSVCVEDYFEWINGPWSSYFLLNVPSSERRVWRRLAIEIAIKWAETARYQTTGDTSLKWLLGGAEVNEWIAVAGLRQIAMEQGLFFDKPLGDPSEEDQLDREMFVRAVENFPSKDLRRESRRVALIGEWQRFHNEPWSIDEATSVVSKTFLEIRFTHPRYQLGLEQRRCERMLDVAVRETLNQLDGDLPRFGDAKYWEMAAIWDELLLDQSWNGVPAQSPVFLREKEEMLDELRSMAERLESVE